MTLEFVILDTENVTDCKSLVVLALLSRAIRLQKASEHYDFFRFLHLYK